jgi:adenylyl- and sulfurtransferase ThiI
MTAMPVNFTTDVNPVTLLAAATSLIAVVRFWLHASQVAEEARKASEACMKCAKDAHQRIELLPAAIHARDITQAERLVSREVLREVEGRLAESIERLGDRLDNLFREVITLRRGHD